MAKGTILVTGGAQRIGKALCLNLAKQGYNIALHYNSSSSEAKKIQTTIRKSKRRCEIFQSDLSVAAQCQTLMSQVHQKFKNIAGLINNASIFHPTQFLGSNHRKLAENFAVHLQAPYILSQEFAKTIKKGNIINMLDCNITNVETYHFDYLLSKKSLQNLTEQLAFALAPHIRVNAIAPGFILPPDKTSKFSEKQRLQTVPLRKKGSVDNITQAVTFVLKNSFITGQTIFVDGGEHLN